MNEEEPADVARQRRVIQINRPTYSQKEFDVEFELNEADTKKRDSIPKRIRSYAKSLDPLGFFSIINLFAEYNFKSFLLADFLSGFTVGIMNIPQALAYGALTSLNPVNGLYTSFYCGLGYVLFGTSKHLSVGTFAVVSLMVYSTIMQVETEYQPRRASEETFAQINLSSLNSSGDDQFDMMRVNTTLMKTFELDTQGMRVNIAASLAFWCGFIQILFSALGLGRISKYMPQSLLRAFTTGAAFHVLSSQVRHVFGIYYVHKKRRKILKLFFIYYRILQNINLINWVAFITSVGSIILLLLVKTQINDRFKKQLRNIPLPIELVVIVIGIVVTYFAQLDQKYDLAIIGKIPQGLPEPSLPDFSLFFYVIKDAIIISVIAFTTSVSVSDLYARKHKYRINSNKEFLALGVANIIGSFFKSFTSCGSLARSAVQESSGGKTQMSTIVSSFVVLAVMLWLSPLLETLPKAILAAIIIAALVNLLKQLRDIPYYWRVDKLDCLTWVITFAGTVLLDVDYGLGIGVITVLFINTYRSQNLELKVVGQVKDYEIFSDVKNYQVNVEQSYKIIRPNHSIFYINSDLFGDTLNTIFPLKDAQTTRPTVCENCKTNYKCLSKCCRKAEEDENANEANKALNQTIRPTALILDCSNLTFIDDSGFKSLSKCIKDYQNDGVRFILTNCHENILKFFANMKFAHEDVFMTIRDALETLK